MVPACTETSGAPAPSVTGPLPTGTAEPGAASSTTPPAAANFSFVRMTEDNDEELIDIAYPVLQNIASAEAAPVNDKIIRAVDELVVNFMDAAGAAPAGESRSTLTLQAAPELINGDVYSASGVSFEFVRGGGPATKRIAWIFSIETESLVSPADLFVDRSLEHLATASRDHLIADVLGDAAAITAPEGLRPTAENFHAVWLTATGIGVGFDQYQVASGELGSPTVLIPYAELLDVLDQTGILAPLRIGPTLPAL